MSVSVDLGPGPDGQPQGLAQLEDRIGSLLADGQTFLAQDLAAAGLKSWPGSVRLRVFYALALTRTGAVGEAVDTLKPVLAGYDTGPLADALAAIASVVRHAGEGRKPGAAALESVKTLVRALDQVREAGLKDTRIEPDLLVELGELYGEAWHKTGDANLLKFGRTLLSEAFAQGGSARAGAQAATCLALLGEGRRAADLATAVLAAPVLEPTTPKAAFWEEGARGLASLLAGDPTGAVIRFGAALELMGRRTSAVVPLLRLVRRLRHAGLEVPAEVDAILKPPGVVVFTGHMLDRPGAAVSRFPQGLEIHLKAEIARRLERMDVQIGYSGAACGSELLFVEALLERDGDANIVLPFDENDYRRVCVAYAGARWEQRFRNALRLAHSVIYATQENYLGHDLLFRFQNQMLHGLATLRSTFLETAPNLLAVWDMQEGSLPGGAADFIDQWTDITKLQIVDLDDLLTAHPVTVAPAAGPAPEPLPKLEPEREIRALLFADFVGYSKLREASVPAFMAFTEKVSAYMADQAPAPIMVNTWGDAVFAVMGRASDMVRFGFALQRAVREFRSREADGVWLDIRISLHAGPVFAGRDPFNARVNFFGTQVNRAARLEPVTVPGHIYATQQFVALLASEESQDRHGAEADGRDWAPVAVCEYVGVMSLAKNFGKEPVYHVRPPVAVTAEVAKPAGKRRSPRKRASATGKAAAAAEPVG